MEVIGVGSIRVGSDYPEWPLTAISRSRHYLKSNISKRCFLGTKLL